MVAKLTLRIKQFSRIYFTPKNFGYKHKLEKYKNILFKDQLP